MNLKDQRFGIEIEMTGVTRKQAAEIAANYLNGRVEHEGTYYDVYNAIAPDGRKWKFTFDSSISAQRKVNGRIERAGNEYKTEMVSPICEYKDIGTIQELVRQLRHKGAFADKSCGIHIHVDASPFDARTLRNLTNIMYSKEDLIYKALEVDVAREHRYCRKTDEHFLQELNRRRPQTLEQLERIWYCGDSRRRDHYDDTRYHCVNLHSVFSHGTVEFRLFNSTVNHAGKIKAYIQLCLAITAQALNQRAASRIKTVSSNEKYTFRTWLLRLGLIGEEFSTARLHLLEHLDGNIAWRDPAQVEQQRERMRARQETVDEEQSAGTQESAPEEQDESEEPMTMGM